MRNDARWPQQAELCSKTLPQILAGGNHLWVRCVQPGVGDLQNVAVAEFTEGEEAAQECQQSSSWMLWKWDKGVGKEAFQQWWGTQLSHRPLGEKKEENPWAAPSCPSLELFFLGKLLSFTTHLSEAIAVKLDASPCKFTWASECKKEVLWNKYHVNT